ncbi:MAG TPA: xanthine dehydrogenase family protein subunit M [Stellaceae bacterium]|jgi:xanthine dehydrogenase YagS FAD-binding subunit
MYPFTYVRAADISGAIGQAAQDPGVEFVAGGTDMLQLLKDDVRRPTRLVDLTALSGLSDVSSAASGGLRIGALARMADVAEHPEIRGSYPVISQALLASASPQVRNMATIGGNLLQRTRCPYFRDVGTPCNKREPGSGCSAIGGENRMHAILGGSDRCVATHASDLAVALVALDAVVVTQGTGGERRIPIETFHLLPGETPDRENVLQPGELIVAVEVPASPFARRSLYRKVRDRASFEFALVSVAVALDIDDDARVIRHARVALGGVGTKPWRSHEAEQALVGAPLKQASFEQAAARALDGAKPLEQNRFKISLAQRTLSRALATVGA